MERRISKKIIIIPQHLKIRALLQEALKKKEALT